MIESGLNLDLDAVLQNVREAEIVCVYFPALERTLLLDTRTAPGVEAFIGLVPIAGSSDARVRSIRRLRPQLPRPQSITMIPWHRRVRSLVECGVWTQLLARLDDPAAAHHCFDALSALERSEIADAITGRGYNVIWSRVDAQSEPPAPRR